MGVYGFLGDVWWVFGGFLVDVWLVFGGFLVGVWCVFAERLKRLEKVQGKRRWIDG